MIAVIGGGISGISVSNILQEKGVPIKLFEKESKIGGLVSCDKIDGVTFHKVGGHVFNTKNQKIKNWFFSKFDLEKEFLSRKRNAKILIDNNFIDYPIENHLYQLPQKTTSKIINELKHQKASIGNNLGDFLKDSFGKTLFEIYFKPYNEKIWQHDLKDFSMDWLKSKFPMPNAEEIILNNIYRLEERKMAHQSFYYPNIGGSQFIVDRLANKIDVKNNIEIKKIDKTSKGWLINGEFYENVIYTGNIKSLSKTLNLGGVLRIDESHFPSHGTTTVLCELEQTDLSWLYLPNPNCKAHRVIFTGNFSNKNNGDYKMTGTIEFSQELSYDEIKRQCSKIPLFKKILACNFRDESYVIQTPKTRDLIKKIKKFLEPKGFYLLGRFAEWEYYNMDNAIEQSHVVADKILNAKK